MLPTNWIQDRSNIWASVPYRPQFCLLFPHDNTHARLGTRNPLNQVLPPGCGGGAGKEMTSFLCLLLEICGTTRNRPLIERGPNLVRTIEVKSSTTCRPKHFRHLDTIVKEFGVPVDRRMVVYAGNDTFETSHGLVCALGDLVKTL